MNDVCSFVEEQADDTKKISDIIYEPLKDKYNRVLHSFAHNNVIQESANALGFAAHIHPSYAKKA